AVRRSAHGRVHFYARSLSGAARAVARQRLTSILSRGVQQRMPAYAVAMIRQTRFNEEIVEYLRRIGEPLVPYSGRYIVHGGPYEPLEGAWSGDLIMIEFPSMDAARRWYHSDAYSAIRKLRTANTDGDVFLVQGVPDDYQATDILERAK